MLLDEEDGGALIKLNASDININTMIRLDWVIGQFQTLYADNADISHAGEQTKVIKRF